VIVAGAAGSVVAIAAAWVMSQLLADAVQRRASLATLMPMLLVVAGLALARGAAAWAAECAGHAAARDVIGDLRARLLRTLAERGPAHLAGGERTGAIAAAATTGLDALDVYFARYLPQMVLGTAIPIMVLAFLVVNDPISALIVAVTLPLIPLFMWLIVTGAQVRIDRRWALLQRLSAYFLDVIQGLPTLRIFGRAGAHVERIRDVTEAYRRTTMSTLSIAFLSSLVLESLASLATAMVAAAIGIRLVDGAMTLQMGFAVLIVVPEAYMPLRQLGTFYHSSKEGLAAEATILDLVDGPSGSNATPRAHVSPTASAIELRGVTCIHGERGEGITEPVTLLIPPRTTTLVCGSSGAGKSTLLGLLVPFRSCTDGTIRVGEVELRDLDVDRWRRRLGWVAQRPSLFPGTVLDNLRVGNSGVSEVEAASLLAHLFPDGTIVPSTRLTEDGEGLSGGERVRVGLARAILRSPSLLLLDEPTAFLDPQAASAVVSLLENLSSTTTMVIATHDPDRFSWADQIMRLDAGHNADAMPLSSTAWAGAGS
jgi:ATP-binding cassette subfamily C protein CydCD